MVEERLGVEGSISISIPLPSLLLAYEELAKLAAELLDVRRIGFTFFPPCPAVLVEAVDVEAEAVEDEVDAEVEADVEVEIRSISLLEVGA